MFGWTHFPGVLWFSPITYHFDSISFDFTSFTVFPSRVGLGHVSCYCLAFSPGLPLCWQYPGHYADGPQATTLIKRTVILLPSVLVELSFSLINVGLIDNAWLKIFLQNHSTPLSITETWEKFIQSSIKLKTIKSLNKAMHGLEYSIITLLCLIYQTKHTRLIFLSHLIG